MSTKAIQNILIGLIFATLLVPLIVVNDLYFPYIVGKAIVFRVIVLTSLVLYSWLIYIDNKFLPTKNNVLLAFGALNVVYLISAFMGPDIRESIFSGFERMDGWITTVLIFVFFVITASVMREKKIWNWFFISQISISIFLFFGSIGQIMEKGINHRADTLLGNPIYLSVIFMFSVFFALYLIFEDYSKTVKILLAISVVINTIGIFITGTRGSMLAVFVSGVMLFLFFTIKFWNISKIKNISLSLLILAILFPTLLFSFKESGFVKNNGTLTRLTQINITEGTGYARFINWGIAVQGIKERPIFGWGQNNYSYVFDKYYDARMYAQEPFFDRAHNIFLDTTIHGGILALVLYLLIFVFAISILFKKQDIRVEQKFILTGLLLAYLIQNIFVFDNITSYLLFAYILSFCVCGQVNTSNINTKKLVIPTTVVILFIFAFSFAVYLPLRASLSLLKGMHVYVKNADGSVALKYKNGIADNREYFENSLGWNQTGIHEIRTSAMQTSNVVSSVQVKDPKIQKDKENFVSFAYQETQKSYKENPNSARAKYFAGIFAANIGDLLSSERYLQEAVQITPNRQLYLEALASVKNSLNKKDEAFEVIKKIYEVEKSNDRAWIEYGNELLQRDQKEYLNFLKETGNEKRITNVMALFDGAINNSPENPQAYVNKAVFLAKIGRMDESIKFFENLKIKFPALSKQLDGWIKELKSGKLPA